MNRTLRHWDGPADNATEPLAEELQRESDRNRTAAAVDLQRTLLDLRLLAERCELTIGAAVNVQAAIEALRAATANQG